MRRDSRLSIEATMRRHSGRWHGSFGLRDHFRSTSNLQRVSKVGLALDHQLSPIRLTVPPREQPEIFRHEYSCDDLMIVSIEYVIFTRSSTDHATQAEPYSGCILWCVLFSEYVPSYDATAGSAEDHYRRARRSFSLANYM